MQMETPISPTGISYISQPANAIVDIVFVHGLQGDPQRTWSLDQASVSNTRSSKSKNPFSWCSRHRKVQSGNSAVDKNQREVFWPRDLLKQDFPTARIMTFGYNSKITQGLEAANQSNIFSHARNLLYELESKRRLVPDRHLIFIVHSLGGIIVKEALRRSEVDPDPKIKTIFSSTTGVFFFGTPHRGSKDWASFGEGITKVASLLLGLDTNSQIIHALLPSGPELELCRESFLTQWMAHTDRLTVRTFQESRAVTGVRWGNFNKLIVPPDSSSLDHPNQRPISIDANHMEMVKFNGRHDKTYELVHVDIYELVSNAEKELHTQHKKNRKISIADYVKHINSLTAITPGNQTGVPITDVTEESLEWFKDSPEFKSWMSADNSASLWSHGLPGSGKTIIATWIRQTLLRSKGYFQERDVASIFCCSEDTELRIVWTLGLQLICRIDRADVEQTKVLLPGFSNNPPDEVDLVRNAWKVLETLITLLSKQEVIFIIDGIDEIGIDIRHQFLQSLQHLQKVVQGKANVRVLISSRDYPDIRDIIGHYPSIERGKEWRECLRTLYYEEWNARENKISDAQEGGSWLSSNEHYQKWLTYPKSDLLFIAGKPASGKSTLVKLIAKSLQAESPETSSKVGWTPDEDRQDFKSFNDTRTIISSFYYSFRGGNTEMSHELMLRSVAYQIFRQNEKFFALIQDRFRKLKSQELDWTYEDLKSVLQSLHDIQTKTRVFIMVDGMDESENDRRNDILGFFSMLSASESRCTLKILIASRPENDIRPWMNRARHITLEQMNRDDIRVIVRLGMQKLHHFRQSTLDRQTVAVELRDKEDIFATAEAYILENSQGVFLWVVLVLKELENFIRIGGYSIDDINNCVRSLPTDLGGLEGFYALMVKRLVKQIGGSMNHEARGRRIFAWVTFSKRPLAIVELRDALAIPQRHMEQLNQMAFDLARARPHDLEQGLSFLCGGFVEVRTLRELVQLIHQTAREFLLSKDRLAKPYDLKELWGDQEIASTCCRCIYLAFTTTIAQNKADTTFSLAEELSTHFSNWNLLPYALSNLGYHLDLLGSKKVAVVSEFERYIKEIMEKPTSYTSLLLSQWIQSQIWLRSVSIPIEKYVASACLDRILTFAAAKGHENALNTLLTLGANPTAAFYAASCNNQLRTVLLLVEEGVDVNAEGGYGDSALQGASHAGHKEVVKELLNLGADPNLQGGYYGNALQAASYAGHKEVVEELLVMGADPNLQGGHYGSALQAASHAGHKDVVEELLDGGADPNLQGGYYGSALQAATHAGHKEVVKRLLDHGADTNLQGGHYGSALPVASHAGHKELVKMLMDAGADMNLPGEHYGSALQAAREAGHEEIVQLLIEHSANTNA